MTTAAKNVGLRPATVSNLCTGKIPVGRAEVRTLVTLASIAGCTLDELIIRGGNLGMIETGIKVLDLFAPVVRGGTMGFVARPGMGQLVLLAELFRRVNQRGYETIMWVPEAEALGISDAVEEASMVCSSLEEVIEQISRIREDKDIFLGADRSIVLSGELHTLRERINEPGARPVTIALVDCIGESVDEQAPYGPLDTLWKLDMDLATRQFYPAIDPITSTSVILEGAQLEASHLTIQQRARKLMRRYRELRSLVQVRGLDKLSEMDKAVYERGERLEAYFTQPFYVAEPFTKKQGEWLSLQEILDSVQGILDGAVDQLEPAQLMYIGSITK